jgi:hypothetical protein
MVDKSEIYKELREKMEDAGFEFEKEQHSHMQNRGSELKFIHYTLNHLLDGTM